MLASVRNCANARAIGTAAAIGRSLSRSASSSKAAASPACARFASARTSSTSANSASPSSAASVSPSSSPSSRTSSRSRVRITVHRRLSAAPKILVRTAIGEDARLPNPAYPIEHESALRVTLGCAASTRLDVRGRCPPGFQYRPGFISIDDETVRVTRDFGVRSTCRRSDSMNFHRSLTQ